MTSPPDAKPPQAGTAPLTAEDFAHADRWAQTRLTKVQFDHSSDGNLARCYAALRATSKPSPEGLQKTLFNRIQEMQRNKASMVVLEHQEAVQIMRELGASSKPAAAAEEQRRKDAAIARAGRWHIDDPHHRLSLEISAAIEATDV